MEMWEAFKTEAKMFFSNKIVMIFKTQNILSFWYMMWYMKHYQFLFQFLFMLIKILKSLAGICKGIKGTVKPSEATGIISISLKSK